VKVGSDYMAIGTGAYATGGAIALGATATAGLGGAIAFGNNAQAQFANSIAIGANAVVSMNNSLALGAGSQATRGAQSGYSAAYLAPLQTSVGEVAIGTAA